MSIKQVCLNRSHTLQQPVPTHRPASQADQKAETEMLHQLDGLCTGVHSVHTGVLMAKCALWTWGHRPECTLFLGSSTIVNTFFESPRPECTPFLRILNQSAHFFLGRFISVHIFSCPSSMTILWKSSLLNLYQFRKVSSPWGPFQNAWKELAGYVPGCAWMVNIFFLHASSRMDSIERNVKAIINISSVSKVSPEIDDIIWPYINMPASSKNSINIKHSKLLRLKRVL